MPDHNTSQPAAWTELQVEQLIGNVLRAGVLISAVVVAAGAVVYLARHGGEQPHYGTFRGEPNELHGVWQTIENALAGSGRGIIQAGLLLLIATPIARVLLSAYAFARQRDGLYVAVSLIVLLLLCVSLFGLTM